MTPQELKNSILQLAIQGKLVEQRPEEGTAEELYRQIQVEKQALIKAGKLKKEKPLPEISEDEIPFEIPESWKWVRLAELCSIVTGKRDANFGSPDGEFNFFTCAKDPIKCNTFSFSGESLLLAGNGDIGNISYYWGRFEAYQRTYVLQPYIEGSYLIYLFYHLQSNWVKYNTGMVYGTAIPYIRLGNVQNYPVALPPLAEQKRIVAKIEELLPLIERYEKAWSRLEDFNKRFPGDMQKSILQMAIQGKLVEQRPEEGTAEELYRQIQDEKQALIKAGKIKKEKPLPEITEDEIPFEIPESWKWVRIAAVTTLNPKNELPDELDTGFIPMPCVMDGFRNYHTYEVRKWNEIKKGFTHFADGDVGVAKITPCFQNRKSVVFKNLPNGYGAGTTELSIVRVISNLIIREYLLWFFKTDYFISNGIQSFTGTAGQQRIHKDYLATCLFPLPPLAEQKRIVARLRELLPLCEKLK